jgi:hypothetical protein
VALAVTAVRVLFSVLQAKAQAPQPTHFARSMTIPSLVMMVSLSGGGWGVLGQALTIFTPVKPPLRAVAPLSLS